MAMSREILFRGKDVGTNEGNEILIDERTN